MLFNLDKELHLTWVIALLREVAQPNSEPQRKILRGNIALHLARAFRTVLISQENISGFLSL